MPTPEEILRDLDAEFVLSCFKAAQEEGDDQSRFRRDVMRHLRARTDLAEPAREQILTLIAEYEARIAVRLRTTAELVQAQVLCRQILADLETGRHGAAFNGAIQTWPSVIAHELGRLLFDLGGRPAGEDAPPPSPEAALFQLRDVFDTLVKFPTLTMARALIAQGSAADGRFARTSSFNRLSGGDWLKFGREAAARVRAASGLGRFHALAGLFDPASPFYRALDAFLLIRNDEIGHGSHRLDPRETAGLLRVIILGDPAAAEELKVAVRPSLAGALHAAAAADPWQGMRLMTGEDPGQSLMGSVPLADWHGDALHQPEGHQTAELPVRLDFADGTALDLGPFVRARICSKCEHRDLFLFDTLYDGHGDGKFDLLDYGRGHKIRRRGREAEDLRDVLKQADQEVLVPRIGEGSLSNREVIEALDAARIERHYLTPRYLRKPFARFLCEHAKGVYWLQAPAHVGKTTFVQGLIGLYPDEAPIVAEDAPEAVAVAAFLCKREYREGAVNFIQGLQRSIEVALKIPGEAKLLLPSTDLALDAANKASGFVAWVDAWRDFAAHYHRLPGRRRLLILVDGLDETDEPARPDSLVHFLPPATRLSDGLYLLLTSRRPGDRDCPTWLAASPPALPGPDSILRPVGLDDDDYRALMRRYAARRLGRGGDDAGFLDLFQKIFDKAEKRFVYVAFLVDRLHRRNLAGDQLDALPTGDALYRDFLDGLDSEFHPKFADAVRDILLELAAEELAHDWIFAGGAQADRATGGILAPEPEYWGGVPLEELARRIDLDQPGKDGKHAYDGRFLEVLLAVQSVLGVSRGAEGRPRYHLGLKELARQIRDHAVLGPQLRRTHARLARVTLDAIDGLAGTALGDHDRAELSRIFDAGCVRVLPHIRLSGSTLLAGRWNVPQAHFVAGDRFRAVVASGRLNEAITLQVLIVSWFENGLSGPIEAAAPQYRRDLAGAYMNRGNAKQGADGHGPLAAIADYDLAVRVMEQLRDALRALDEAAWTPEYRNDLARAYMNRGVAKQGADGHGPLAAIADYDLAVRVMEQLRDALRALDEAAWTPEYRNGLASAYVNRGVAKQRADGHGPLAAIADYDLAVRVMEQLRDALRALDEAAGTPEYRNGLAGAYMNRGNAKQGADGHGPLAAIADYDLAVRVMEQLRDALRALDEAAWTPEYRNDLARAYMNRGNAKQGADGHGPLAAIADYDLAVRVMEQLRDALRALDEAAWTPEYRNGLARAYVNRGVAKQGADGHGPLAAIADYDLAVRVREQLRDALRALDEAAWTPEYRNGLAGAYMNRGNAKQGADGHGPLAAIADYDLAVRVREQLRDALRALDEAAWTPEYRNDLAGAYVNRGNAKQGADGHGPLAAIADYDLAVRVMEQLRDALRALDEAAWTPEYRNNLAIAYFNRAQAVISIAEHKPRACRDLHAASAIWAEMIRRAPQFATLVNPWIQQAKRQSDQFGCPDVTPRPAQPPRDRGGWSWNAMPKPPNRKS